jgi:2-keto-4-pentenoate hydratase/2-oxohepta-3-ene-1,7-dioic acid hydratase in catechol pathway
MQLEKEEIGKFVALGCTFLTHQQETERTYRWPDLWTIPEEGIINENEAIQLPERVEEVKPGAELTAVIGRETWQASSEEAWRNIKGFTISNDVTASGDWPLISDPDHGGSGVGYKSFPTFSPILSEYQPKQDLENYSKLDIEVLVDGEISVSGSTEQMGFSIPEMISFASNIIKLQENDVVALGDPGNADVFLDEASEVTCSIESIGELSNPIEKISN